MQTNILNLVLKTAAAILFIAMTACGEGALKAGSDGDGGGGGSSGGGSSGGGSSGGGSSGGGGPITTSSYTIDWTSPNDPQVTGFRVYFSTTSLAAGGSPFHVDVPASATSVDIFPGNQGVRVGQTLYVAVSSLGAGNSESPVSSQTSMLVD